MAEGFQTWKQKFQAVLLIVLTTILFKYYLVTRESRDSSIVG